MKLTLIPQDRVAAVWPHLAHIIHRLEAAAHGKYEAADLEAACVSGKMQLWLATSDDRKTPMTVALTEIVDYPRQAIGRVVGCAGTGLKDFMPFLRDLEEWAKTQGCKGMQAVGRDGWIKALPAGYRKAAVVMERVF